MEMFKKIGFRKSISFVFILNLIFQFFALSSLQADEISQEQKWNQIFHKNGASVSVEAVNGADIYTASVRFPYATAGGHSVVKEASFLLHNAESGAYYGEGDFALNGCTVKFKLRLYINSDDQSKNFAFLEYPTPASLLRTKHMSRCNYGYNYLKLTPMH